MKLIQYFTITSALTISAALSGCRSSNPEEYTDTVYVHVNCGDTLWALVSENSFDGTRNEYDIREVISEVRKINGITDFDIYPGQELILPVYRENIK